MIHRMRHLAALMESLLAVLLSMLLAVMVLSITWQVLSRYFLQDPSSWTEELARFALIWTSLLGGALAYRSQGHVGIDLLRDRLAPSGKRRLDQLAALTVAVFSILALIIGGSNLVMITAELEQRSAALGWQMAWVYGALPLTGVLLLVFACDAFLAPVQKGDAARSGAEP